MPQGGVDLNELLGLVPACDGLSNAQFVAARVSDAEIAHAIWTIPDGDDNGDARIHQGRVVVVYAGYAEIDMRCTRRLGPLALRESDLNAVPANGGNVWRITP